MSFWDSFLSPFESVSLDYDHQHSDSWYNAAFTAGGDMPFGSTDSCDDAHGFGGFLDINPSTGLSMIEDSVIDVSGTVFGDSMDTFGSGWSGGNDW